MGTPSNLASPKFPPFFYRVQRAGAQTEYDFSTGFRAKNLTTIIDGLCRLDRFGLAHLRQTDISSPFISVYCSHAHAQEVACYFARLYKEDTLVVTIDTNHLSRGPVFWAAHLLESQELTDKQKWLHDGECLLMYWITREAIRNQTLVSKETWSYGAIGGPGGPSTVTSTGSNGSFPRHSSLLIKLRKPWDEMAEHLPGRSLFVRSVRTTRLLNVWFMNPSVQSAFH
jgi:hypothetical protein